MVVVGLALFVYWPSRGVTAWSEETAFEDIVRPVEFPVYAIIVGLTANAGLGTGDLPGLCGGGRRWGGAGAKGVAGLYCWAGDRLRSRGHLPAAVAGDLLGSLVASAGPEGDHGVMPAEAEA